MTALRPPYNVSLGGDCWQQWNEYWTAELSSYTSWKTITETRVSTSLSATTMYDVETAPTSVSVTTETWYQTGAENSHQPFATFTNTITRSIELGGLHSSATSTGPTVNYTLTKVKTYTEATLLAPSITSPSCILPSLVAQCQSEWAGWIAGGANLAIQPLCTQASVDSRDCQSVISAYYADIPVHGDKGVPAWVTNGTSVLWPTSRTYAPGCSMGCQQCAITGENVQLLYWPPSTATLVENGTVTARPAHPVGNASYLMTAMFGNVTLTSPTVYISYDTLHASNSCSGVGGRYRNTIIPVSSKDLSSLAYQPLQAWAIAPGQWGRQMLSYEYLALPFNIEDLIEPIPDRVFNKLPWCQRELKGWQAAGFNASSFTCSPRDIAYAPLIAVPTEVQNIDPAWKSCTAWYGGLFDPPVALQGVPAAATPTRPSVVQTAAASPGSSVVDSQPKMTSSADDPQLTTFASTIQHQSASTTITTQEQQSESDAQPTVQVHSPLSAGNDPSELTTSPSTTAPINALSVLSAAQSSAIEATVPSSDHVLSAPLASTAVVSSLDDPHSTFLGISVSFNPAATSGSVVPPDNQPERGASPTLPLPASQVTASTLDSSGSGSLALDTETPLRGLPLTATLPDSQTSSQLIQSPDPLPSNALAVLSAALSQIIAETNTAPGGSSSGANSATTVDPSAISLDTPSNPTGSTHLPQIIVTDGAGQGSSAMTASLFITTLPNAAGPTSVAEQLGKSSIFTAGSQTYTAYQQSSIDELTIYGQETTFALPTGGSTILNSQTIAASSLLQAQATLSSSVVVISSETFTLVWPSDASGVAVVANDGATLTLAVSSGFGVLQGQTVSMAQSNAVDFGSGLGATTISAPDAESATAEVITIGSQVFTASQMTSAVVLVDGETTTTLSVGAKATHFGSSTLSVDSAGQLIVGTSTVNFLPSLETGAVISIGSSLATVIAVPSRTGVLLVDGIAITSGGQAKTIDDQVVSDGSAGLIVGSATWSLPWITSVPQPQSTSTSRTSHISQESSTPTSTSGGGHAVDFVYTAWVVTVLLIISIIYW